MRADVNTISPNNSVEKLCPNCGLCCNGVLFADVELRVGDDAKRLQKLGLTLEGDVSVLLIGLVNPKADSKANLERGFRADRFRPLEELQNEKRARQTDEEKKELLEPIEV